MCRRVDLARGIHVSIQQTDQFLSLRANERVCGAELPMPASPLGQLTFGDSTLSGTAFGLSQFSGLVDPVSVRARVHRIRVSTGPNAAATLDHTATVYLGGAPWSDPETLPGAIGGTLLIELLAIELTWWSCRSVDPQCASGHIIAHSN